MMDEFKPDTDNKETVKKAINQIWTFLKDFIPLANTHGSEFISQGHWERFVPVSIQHQLLALRREDLVSLPIHKNSGCSQIGDNHNELFDFITGATSCHLENLNILSTLTESNESFKGVVAESMSEKKTHEVKLMANTVADMVKRCEAELVVDIGSGKGYLSLELAGHHKLNVLGLDSSQTNTHGAQYRKEKLKSRWPALVAKTNTEGKGKMNSFPGPTECDDDRTIDCYIPVTQYVTSDMNITSLLSQHAISLCGQTNPEDVKAVIAGLHTCGSLAVSAMRLCLTDTRAVALCLVACCYQLMEEETKDKEEKHFPLSEFGQSLGLHLGRNARNLASQSVHRIAASGQLQGEEFYWRALLDVIIDKLKLTRPERIVGIRGLNKRNGTFLDYARKAFEKLGFPHDELTPEFTSEMECQYQNERAKMASFFQLKLALAPAIESIILLDRLLFLQEQTSIKKVELVQLFDPVTSPRCYALFATKGNFG